MIQTLPPMMLSWPTVVSPPSTVAFAVYDDLVFNGRVALLAGSALDNAESTQRHTLVELHLVTDHGGLADDYPGAVIYAEGSPDLAAPGWMSMPVRACATSASNLGTRGTARVWSTCASLWTVIARKPG